MDDFIAEEEKASAYPTACGPKCSFCCYTQEIFITELEGVSVVRAIASSPQRKDIIARIQRGKPTSNGHKGPPCAMLDKNGLCSVHSSRPATCRAYISTSHKACKQYAQGRAPRPDTIRAFPYLVHKMTWDICGREAEDRTGSHGRAYKSTD